MFLREGLPILYGRMLACGIPIARMMEDGTSGRDRMKRNELSIAIIGGGIGGITAALSLLRAGVGWLYGYDAGGPQSSPID